MRYNQRTILAVITHDIFVWLLAASSLFSLLEFIKTGMVSNYFDLHVLWLLTAIAWLVSLPLGDYLPQENNQNILAVLFTTVILVAIFIVVYATTYSINIALIPVVGITAAVVAMNSKQEKKR
ncbi:MAG: hypothetical protein NUV82_02755 [Candidatus Komeilibacteria bacterium]|nr:hypothetical protein [Candidatus Komeilibacteria bacterium]